MAAAAAAADHTVTWDGSLDPENMLNHTLTWSGSLGPDDVVMDPLTDAKTHEEPASTESTSTSTDMEAKSSSPPIKLTVVIRASRPLHPKAKTTYRNSVKPKKKKKKTPTATTLRLQKFQQPQSLDLERVATRPPKAASPTKPEDQVIHYIWPYNHFLSRNYQQLQKTLQPALLAEVTQYLLSSIKDRVFEAPLPHVPDGEAAAVGFPLPTQYGQLKQLYTAVLMDLKDVNKTKEVFRRMGVMFKNPELHLYDPRHDAFLLTPGLHFYIFREKARTVYVIKNTTHWTSMMHRRTQSQEQQHKPENLVELEHLRACFMRWLRQRKMGRVPDGFVATPQNVRRLVTSTTLKPLEAL